MAPLIRVNRLSKIYRVGKREIIAVNSLSLDIEPGETVGLVGESGCGKSTLAKALLYLDPPTSGSVEFEGEELAALNSKKMKALRQKMQIVFQDPYASLNPRMTILDSVGEALDIHRLAKGEERRERVQNLLKRVGLNPFALHRFPHEFSGGQRQRLCIARALASGPSFVVCDEALSSLDLSIQAQVVNLLQELQQEMNLTYLFIAHDLAMVRHLSTRVGVMYLGHLVEIAPTEELFTSPHHPYTQALLEAIPIPDPKRERAKPKLLLHGEPPSPLSPPSGCPFHTRCPHALPLCQERAPPLIQLSTGHHVACHLHPEG